MNKNKSKSTDLTLDQKIEHIVTPADGTVGAILNTVTKEDVIAILVQERSDELAVKKAAAEAESHRLDAAIQSVQARWTKATADHKKKVNTSLDDKAIKALVEAGFFHKLVVEVDDGQRNDDKGHFTFNVVLKCPEKSYYSYYNMSRSVDIRYDAKAHEILAETARLKREIATVQQHMLAIKREIADLPVMERRARAKLAQVSLSRDKDGETLLAQLRQVKSLSASNV